MKRYSEEKDFAIESGRVKVLYLKHCFCLPKQEKTLIFIIQLVSIFSATCCKVNIDGSFGNISVSVKRRNPPIQICSPFKRTKSYFVIL